MSFSQFKTLSLTILFLFGFLFQASAEALKKVKISGNKRISKETILVLGDINIGNELTTESLNNSLKKLYDTNFFSDIKLSQENDILIINLIENPIIENIKITGIKKESFKTIILDSMYLKNRMSYSEAKFKNDVVLINNILKSNGYYFAQVKTTLEKDNELNSIKLNLDIELGEKARIKNIVFIGDKKVKDKRLLELIASEEHKFWKFLSNKVFLNKSLIDLDKRLLENFYKNNGYYNVKVLNSFAEL